MSDLYEEDLLLWSEQQAALLRRRAAGELLNEHSLDWTNLAEEIEDLGKSQRVALYSQVRRVLEHLMKLAASPAADPRRGWYDTIASARADIEDLLRTNPSLRPRLAEIVAEQLPRARAVVAEALRGYGEEPGVPLETLQYGVSDVLPND